jgi:hypothetical protein
VSQKLTKNQTKDFPQGIRVKIEFIDPDADIFIWLPEHREWRFAGKFDPNTGILFMKRFEKHRHRILNAFGVSAYVIEALEEYGLNLFVLDVEDTRETLTSTLDNAKACGQWKWWKEGGFDKQLFLPIPRWEQKK